MHCSRTTVNISSRGNTELKALAGSLFRNSEESCLENKTGFQGMIEMIKVFVIIFSHAVDALICSRAQELDSDPISSIYHTLALSKLQLSVVVVCSSDKDKRKFKITHLERSP